jgi:nucleoside-triphosphatase
MSIKARGLMRRAAEIVLNHDGEPRAQATCPADLWSTRKRQDHGDPARRRRGTGRRGFYIEEIRDKGGRRGFRLVSFDGTAVIIAHVDFPESHCVGKYGVDVQAIDNAAALLRPDPKARVYFVDEIGKMKCLSEHFVTAMRALMSSEIPTVATVGARGGGFIAEVKRRTDCELWQVTHADRDKLPARILAWLDERVTESA